MSAYTTIDEENKSTEVNLERKGGVQMTISFNDEPSKAGRGGKGHGPRRRELRPKRQQKNASQAEEKMSQEM